MALAIPKQVHRVWLGGTEPDWTRPFAASWQRPGWQLVEWDDHDVAALYPLRNQEIFDAAEEIAPNHVGQLRSDVVRLEILERFGGVYVDTDFECLRPIDPLIDGLECFAAWEVEGRWVNNAIMGARPSHAFVDRLIEGLPASVERNRGSKPNRMSGPQYVTSMWAKHGAGVEVLPQRLFYPYGFAEIGEHGPGEEWGDAYAVHHWNNRRRERGVPVAA